MNSQDLRYQKVHDSIQSAFWNLLKTKGFQKTSATDIIKAAGINRSTFYAHYLDKYDLLDQLEDELFQEILSYAKNSLPELPSERELFTLAISDYFEKVIFFFHERGEVFLLLLGPNGDSAFSKKLYNAIHELWCAYKITPSVPLPEAYIQSAIVGMITSLLTQWIQSDFKESPEEFKGIVISLLTPIYKNVVFYN